jgi:transposase
MYIVGVDYHPSFQHIAFLDQETGECGDRRLNHSDGEAEKFYRELRQKEISVRVGLEATGYSRWFERLLSELGIEVWIGNAAEIKAKRVRKQKTDRQDAQLLLKLLEENRFPRIWVPSPENRDLRHLLWHRHRLVQMRTRIMNQLQALAMRCNSQRAVSTMDRRRDVQRWSSVYLGRGSVSWQRFWFVRYRGGVDPRLRRGEVRIRAVGWQRPAVSRL